MPRYSREDDDRRSSQHESYGSSKDRHSHHHKHRGHMLEDDGSNEKELNKRGYRDRRQRESSRGSVKSYTERSKYDDHGHTRNHGAGRRYGYDADGEKEHRHRSSSPSDDKFHHRAAFQSDSPRRKSKRTSGFDMAPPVAIDSTSSSEQLTGAFATTQTRMMPNIVSETTQMNMFGPVSLFPNLSMTQQATRHARRVYVGGLPPLANEDTISKFFSFVMAAVGGNAAGPGDAVVNVYINHEKKFAFVEMRTVEEASNAMALDGIVFEGLSVRVRRPTDYNISLAAPLGPCQPSPLLNLAAVGLTSGTGEAHGPDRIFVGGVPYYFTEVQMKELLEAFGPLRGCDLVKDRETGNSKGYGFCVFEDPSVTDIACASLNGLKLGDKTLTVRRATVSGQSKPEQEYILTQTQQHITIQKALVAAVTNLPNEGIESPTKILCLSEAVTTDELMDDVEYKEILEDMREECQKFGELVNIIIPRPAPEAAPIEGLGKVFLEYRDTVGSAKAKCALSGRKFGGNIVTALYYPEEKYFERNYAAA